MLRILATGPHATIVSTLCAACPSSPAGCCAAPPRLDWSDAGRIVALGGRDWLLGEIEAGRIVPGEKWLTLRRRKIQMSPSSPRLAACIYVGPTGCTIASDRRPATCNYYVCEEALSRGGDEAARARVEHAARVDEYVRWEAEIVRRAAERWPEGPSYDAAFLDWLGAQFEALAGAAAGSRAAGSRAGEAPADSARAVRAPGASNP